MVGTLAEAVSTVLNKRWPQRYPFTPEVSAVEQELADTLCRHSTPTWHQQVRVATPFSDFYLDMGCRLSADRVIGVECDGLDYHQDKLRDCCRDALILGTGRVACVYRIDAWAVHKRRYDVLRLLGELEPGLFPDGIMRTIQEVAAGIEANRAVPGRARRFLHRMQTGAGWVTGFLAFAEKNRGISFGELVKRARRHDVPFA